MLVLCAYSRLRNWTFLKKLKLKKAQNSSKKLKLKQKNFKNSSRKTQLWVISLKLLNFIRQSHISCQDLQDFWLKVWYLYGKLKLKTQFPANSFGLFAETWSNF